METGDVTLGLWLSVLVAVVVVAWFPGVDATDERRRRQLVRLERMLLWIATLAVAAGVLAMVGLVFWRWVA